MNHEFDSDQDYYQSIALDPEEERDPAETSLEASPEGLGLDRVDLVQWAEDERAKAASDLAWARRVAR